MELSFLGVNVPGNKVPGNESFTLWNFRSRERKFLGTKVPATRQPDTAEFYEVV